MVDCTYCTWDLLSVSSFHCAFLGAFMFSINFQMVWNHAVFWLSTTNTDDSMYIHVEITGTIKCVLFQLLLCPLELLVSLRHSLSITQAIFYEASRTLLKASGLFLGSEKR